MAWHEEKGHAMNRLPLPQQVQVISLLTESNSIRAIERLTGVHRDTIMRLGKRVGEACHRLHHARMRGLQVNCLELDETWGFVGKKQKNIQDDDPDEFGDAYLWLAIDAHKKIIISYLVGKRTAENALALLTDVRGRVINRPQITTDALAAYEDAVDRTFGSDGADYVMMNKKAGEYQVQRGHPNMDHVTTNHIERANLTLRNHLRRHVRHTSGHSKKMDHHQAAIALQIAHYNFCRVHETLRVTPTMEFGLTTHIWSIGEMICAAEATPVGLPPLPTPPPFPRPGRQRFQVIVGRRGRVS